MIEFMLQLLNSLLSEHEALRAQAGLDALEQRKIFSPQLRIAPSILSHSYYTQLSHYTTTVMWLLKLCVMECVLQKDQKRPSGNESGDLITLIGKISNISPFTVSIKHKLLVHLFNIFSIFTYPNI